MKKNQSLIIILNKKTNKQKKLNKQKTVFNRNY
jgi:hypothetical protein